MFYIPRLKTRAKLVILMTSFIFIVSIWRRNSTFNEADLDMEMQLNPWVNQGESQDDTNAHNKLSPIIRSKSQLENETVQQDRFINENSVTLAKRNHHQIPSAAENIEDSIAGIQALDINLKPRRNETFGEVFHDFESEYFNNLQKLDNGTRDQDTNIISSKVNIKNINNKDINAATNPSVSHQKKTKQAKVQYMNGGMLPLLNQSQLYANYDTSKEPFIPHIIHQTWDTYNVPKLFIPWIKSVIEHHPKWLYMFWTQDDVTCYFKAKHPEFADIYDSYWATIFKTDVMRYFLLHDYGGFYLDLDVECLKPLDIWTYFSYSILTHETYEQVFLLKDIDVSKPNVMTTILATRPFHPYYKMMQEKLEVYKERYPQDVLRATGPYFMQSVLEQYQMIRNNVTNISKISSYNDVSVINPSYWLPTYDPLLTKKKKVPTATLR